MKNTFYDEKNNTLTINYRGAFEISQAEELYAELLKLLPKYKKGFRVISDFTDTTVVSPDVRETLKKIMDFLNTQGVQEIIRIIPNPAIDIGFNIMSLFHYSKEVKFITVNSREDAHARLRTWETNSKIAFVEMKEAWQKEFIQNKLPGKEVLFFEETAQECGAALKGVNILSVFIHSRITAELIAKLPGLQCVTTRSTGFDHIDLKAARARDIPVFNVPVYGENTVAEHTFALILSLSRNLRKAYLRTLDNDFRLDGLMGFDLKGKTLGVIGTGHIGLHVIRMALGFGMTVIAHDIRKQDFLSEVLDFEYVSLEALLQRSDIISLHAPYLPATHHLINRKNIGFIKKGAVLVNTARGGLVETEALVEALDKKILSGAGLDVLEDEAYLLEEKRSDDTPENRKHWQKLQDALKNHVLLHRENVIFTPHMAFYSREAVERILETTLQNIQDFTQARTDRKILPSS